MELLTADNRSEKRKEPFGLHVDRFDAQSEIVGCCVVPAPYVNG